MLLGDIFDTGDYESLVLHDEKKYEKEIQDIIHHIIQTKDFSALRIGVELSVNHAKKYVNLITACGS